LSIGQFFRYGTELKGRQVTEEEGRMQANYNSVEFMEISNLEVSKMFMTLVWIYLSIKAPKQLPSQLKHDCKIM
jgi:hypothetical protein